MHDGDRLLFYSDGLLEARDLGGRFFRLDQQAAALRRPDLQAAADDLLSRLRARTRHLDDDIAILLAELTLTSPASRPSPSPSSPPRQSGGPWQARPGGHDDHACPAVPGSPPLTGTA